MPKKSVWEEEKVPKKFYIPKSLEERLSRFCKRTGLKESAVVSFALEEYLNKHFV